MPRPYKVAHLRKNFLDDIDSAEKLVASVRGLENINPKGPIRSLHSKHVARVIELAFMGVVAEWEDFLEQTFVRYLAGGTSDNSYQPIFNVGKATNIAHSYAIISQNSSYDPEKHFLRFSDPKWTLDRADFFFAGGDPYSKIRSNLPRLREAIKIRNRVAHSSTKCKADFKSVALAYTNPSGTQLRQAYRVGDLLSSKSIRHFGQAAINQNWDYLKAFFELYRDLAKLIAP